MRTSRLLSLAFSLLLLLVAVSSMRAQHCGFCGSSISLIEPRDAATDSVIPGLRITLIDSTGRPRTREVEDWNGHEFTNRRTEAITFWQLSDMPNQGTRLREIDAERRQRLVRNRYAAEYIIHWDRCTGDTVVIEDVDGEANGGYFPTVRVPLDSCPWTSLCSGTHCPWSNRKEYLTWKWGDDAKVVMMGTPRVDPLPMNPPKVMPAIAADVIESLPDLSEFVIDPPVAILPELPVAVAPEIVSSVVLLIGPKATHPSAPVVPPALGPVVPDALLK